MLCAGILLTMLCYVMCRDTADDVVLCYVQGMWLMMLCYVMCRDTADDVVLCDVQGYG
jgi:hypothetical protein